MQSLQKHSKNLKSMKNQHNWKYLAQTVSEMSEDFCISDLLEICAQNNVFSLLLNNQFKPIEFLTIVSLVVKNKNNFYYETNSFLTTEPSEVKNVSLILSSVNFEEFATKSDLVLRKINPLLKNSNTQLCF